MDERRDGARREGSADAHGKTPAPAACNSYSQRTSQNPDAESASPPPRARKRGATSPTPQIAHGKEDSSGGDASSEKASDARDDAMDLNNEGPDPAPMDMDQEGRGFSYVHDLEWHLGVSPMKALAPATPGQSQPAPLANGYAGRHWAGAMAGDTRGGGREAGAETDRESERGGWVVNGRHFGVCEGDEQDGNARRFVGGVPVRISCDSSKAPSPHSTACFDILLPLRTHVHGFQRRLINASEPVRIVW